MGKHSIALTIGLCLLLTLPACGQGQSKQLSSNQNKIITGDVSSLDVPIETDQKAEPTASVKPETIEVSPSPEQTTTLPGMTTAAKPEAPTETAAPKETTAVQQTASPTETTKPEGGIIVKSDNILSTQEKEALLKELEKELDSLFGVMNASPEDQEPLAE